MSKPITQRVQEEGRNVEESDSRELLFLYRADSSEVIAGEKSVYRFLSPSFCLFSLDERQKPEVKGSAASGRGKKARRVITGDGLWEG